MTSTALVEKLEILKTNLSPESSINFHAEEAYKFNTQRWSDYKAPKPGAVVNVTSEQDIEQTISWATSNNVKFVAQSGGHGWTTTFSIGPDDIVINLRQLNSVSVDTAANIVTLGGGTLVHELVAEAAKNSVNVVAGTCNTVGVVGACVGGGVHRFQGLYSLGIDNMISARLVTAAGRTVNVSSTENPDLWWGLRGAGHSFGIISSLTLKTYPWVNDGMIWLSFLVFTPDSIEAVSEAINKLGAKACKLTCSSWLLHLPLRFPAVAVSAFYPGCETSARSAFSSLLSLAIAEQSQMTPYAEINTLGDPFCAKGGCKVAYAASISSLDGPTLVKIWDLYLSFVKDHKDVGQSAVMVECYPNKKILEIPTTETAFKHRHVPHIAAVLPIYSDPATEEAARAWGTTCRQLLRDASGAEKRVLVTFASGDESKEEMYGYGGNVEKLTAMKDIWDPERVFSQYSPPC